MVASNQQLRTFAAIDFETATAKRSSACALGLVIVDSGRIVDEQSWLIRPPGNEYHSFNTRLHGISASDTEDAASFGQVWSEAAAIAQDHLLVVEDIVADMKVPADTLVGDIVADAITFALAATDAENAATEIANAAITAMSEAMEAATAKDGRAIVYEIVNSLSQWQPPRSQQTWILGSVELRSPP